MTPSVSSDSGHLLLMVRDLFDNAVLWWGLAACGVAQLSKLGVEWFVHGRWRPAVPVIRAAWLEGIPPVSTSTAAGVGWYQGFQDPLFALAAAVAFVVLYDASGVRRAAGLTAARVNALVSGREPGHETGGAVWEHPLKENLGHTRTEVLVGSLVGPLVALPGLALVGSPLHLAMRLSHGLTAAAG